MTTIACNKEMMACDSRTSYGDSEFTTVGDKIELINGSLVGCAGPVDSIFKFLQWFRLQEKDRPEFADDSAFSAIVLNKHGIFWYCNTTYPSKVLAPFFSVGSGSQAAMGAMFAGADPKQAVAIAIKCDKHSGGPVRAYSL